MSVSLDLLTAPARLAALDALAILDTPPEEGFDAIAHLATSLCATPVALVSLVASDRQWFKARVGFPCSQTDLNSSVCAYALAEPDLLVIPDLAEDSRTRSNPLVAGEPFIRFYAGAPLRTASGLVLGTLCVIDHVARPDGLSTRQAADLRALASQVVSQLELRQLLHERNALVEARTCAEKAASERSRILETVTDHVGQAIFQMDTRGVVTFANPAASTMFGWSHDEIVGANLHNLIHHSYPDGRVYPAEDCPMRRALLEGALLAGLEETYFRKDGTSLIGLVTNAPVKLDGKVASVVVTLNDITERRLAEAKLAASEAHWRGLFEELQEGLVIGEVVRDDKGIVVDWRYIEVNTAWTRLTGFAAEDAVGRSLRDLIPDVEDEWIDEPAHVVDSGEPVTFTRKVGRLGRWFEGRVSRLSADRFVLLFLDVTDQIASAALVAAATRRKSALAQLGDTLRSSTEIGAMSYNVAAIVGPTLGAAQAAYATVDAATDMVDVVSSWRAPGIASIVGRHSLRNYGTFVADLKVGKVVTIPDIRADARTCDQHESFEALGIAGLINVPVVERGELVAMLAVLFSDPHDIPKDDEEFVKVATDRAQAAIARMHAEERQTVLNRELSHRLKNTLAMVQAIANQTLRGVEDRGPVVTFEKRLMALATAHDILLRKDFDAADLAEVVDRVLETAGGEGRYEAEGPPVKLGPRAALSTSLLLHELTTNASKYGALTQDTGKIVVRWWFEDEKGADALVVDWRETGGPPAIAPTRKGFGSRLLTMGLVGTGGSNLIFGDDGFEARFRASVRHVEGT